MYRTILSFVSVLAIACSSVDNMSTVETEGLDPNSPLLISIVEDVNSRGELVEFVSDMGSIGVYCARTGDEELSEGNIFDKMDNRLFNITDDGECEIDGEAVSWGYETTNDTYTFFAYSPFKETKNGITPHIVDGELLIDYTVPSLCVNQPDLMYSEPLKDIFPRITGAVPLSFKHSLAAISFGVQGSDNSKIIKIELNNVAHEGTLSWNYDDEKNPFKWEITSKANGDFSIDIDEYNIDKSTQISSETDYLMMIPQELTAGATVIATLDNDEELDFEIAAGSVWKAGSTYHYIINLEEGNEYIFDATQISNCYIINPIKGEKTIVQVPIERRINDFWENYATPSTTKITDQTKDTDLSADMVWRDFDVDMPYTCKVIFDDDNEMAVRIIIPAEVQMGNTLFSVSDCSGNVLWSWHLWLTDYNPDAIADANRNAIVADTDMAYTLEGYSGSVHRYRDDDDEGDRKDDNLWSGIYSDKFIMDRNIGRCPITSNGLLYYQFGRKDPFPYSGAVYASNATSMPTAEVENGDFADAVSRPDTYFYSNDKPYNWCCESIVDQLDIVWYDKNITNENYATRKSIFDPSPLGWRIPKEETWSNIDDIGYIQLGSDVYTVAKYNLYGRLEPSRAGRLTQFGAYLSIWSANHSEDAGYGYSLNIHDYEASAPRDRYLSCGLSARAVEE